MKVARFRLGHAPDVGHLAGIPGVTPLVLRGEVFIARVADPDAALEELRRCGFRDVRLEEPTPGAPARDDAGAPHQPLNTPSLSQGQFKVP